MLFQNSNIFLEFIFSTFIPHNDIRIKASKGSNFNEAYNWLLIAFSFEILLSQIEILEGMTRYLLPKFHEVWPISISLHKIAMPHIMICFRIHASKFCTNYLHHVQPPSIQNFTIKSLQLLLWHSDTNFFITWIILWIEKFWCVETR